MNADFPREAPLPDLGWLGQLNLSIPNPSFDVVAVSADFKEKYTYLCRYKYVITYKRIHRNM